jgi:hypothetical protein
MREEATSQEDKEEHIVKRPPGKMVSDVWDYAVK